MTVWILLVLGVKLSGDNRISYSDVFLFNSSQTCLEFKNTAETRLKSHFDKLEMDCRRKEINK